MGNIGIIPPMDKYLEFLRDITLKNGIILIFDEVITGFRISEGGAQEYFGVTPDLVTFGKILGGGFPIGAISGKKELMEMLAPSGNVYQAGTFNGNPISITAGLATLKQLNNSFYSAMNTKGDSLRDGIQDILDVHNLDYQVAGLSSMFQIYFTENEVWNYEDAKTADTEKFNIFFQTLLNKGCLINLYPYPIIFIFYIFPFHSK